jgi:hypothetical protein
MLHRLWTVAELATKPPVEDEDALLAASDIRALLNAAGPVDLILLETKNLTEGITSLALDLSRDWPVCILGSSVQGDTNLRQNPAYYSKGDFGGQREKLKAALAEFVSWHTASRTRPTTSRPEAMLSGSSLIGGPD